jgi:DNA-directed RNA polymerase specialized sigma24 family protein
MLLSVVLAMSETKFHQLALLARLRNSKAKQAAMIYLCKGGKQAEIAQQLGIAQSTVSQAVHRIRMAQAQAFRAARP